MKTITFMEKFDRMDVLKKLECVNKIEADLPNRKLSEQPTLRALIRWGTMNAMVGNELCPPTMENLKTYMP